ncbi:TetR/AcrR family transcriptional regulator [Enterococcus sp. LJL99]
MVRKKVYTKEQILAATQQIVVKEGFSSITARNVAEYMGISTQPIYLEFKNMQELKSTLVSSIYDYLKSEFYSKRPTGDAFIDFGMNSITFAQQNRELFLALYVDQHEYSGKMKQRSFELFRNFLDTYELEEELSADKMEEVHLNVWIVATGIASLGLSGIIQPSEEQMIDLLTLAI